MTKKDTPLPQNREVLKKMSKSILAVFSDFKMPMKLVDAVEGYRQYHFYFSPKKRIRMKSVHTFVDDLRFELGVDLVEIEAPIPDKKLIGITVPKKPPFAEVDWKSVLRHEDYQNVSPLTVPIGVNEFGTLHLADIVRMPHALIAGTTGSGKSMFLHTLINYLLEKNTPDDLRFILVDPKRVELTMYNKLPHLLTPVVTQSKKAIQALSWTVKEMERRYDILEAERVQNISTYHQNIYQPAKKEWEKEGKDEEERVNLPEALPYIVIIIDELNDIMQAYPSELESLVVRLSQMSRAVGIHMIITTSRPSNTVLTGSIKANIPSRVAFSTASYVDSRMIIDMNGAEKLSGSGDMLYQVADNPRPVRIQGFSITESEIRERVEEWKKLDESFVLDTLDLSDRSGNEAIFNSLVSEGGDESDELYEEAKQAVIKAGKASTSYIQRSLRVGYSRAARLMDLLEENGVIGPAEGSRPREVNRE
jgi:DNA segregation ATPase FtsK/SpoIIIE, S-DNA-T family